jgi:hypothetical protein
MVASNGEVQTYVVANYNSSAFIINGVSSMDQFPNAPDVVALAGAIAGWMNDPMPNSPATTSTALGSSQTPAYDAIENDQIPPSPPGNNTTTSCQSTLLEPFDPFVGSLDPNAAPPAPIFPITMNNGFTYHVPDLAFKEWFYGGSPSAFNQKFSLFGTFTTAALPPLSGSPCP